MTSLSLYERLGGEEKIRQIAADIFDNHAGNGAVKARFVKTDRAELIRLVTEFVCAGTGGLRSILAKTWSPPTGG
jgi:hemoglobin